MAADAVWGLDIGQCALKAVKARVAGPLMEVLAFDHIEYRQPLSAGGDSSASIREALGTFLNRNEIDNCDFAVSIAAGRSALIRFIKLPPVDMKKVPDIVRYEATQQIPFPLEDVIWDYQVIERQYAPGEELEVGIFAMRRDAIFNFLSNLMVSGVEVGSIQLAAAALYNCVHYDHPLEDGTVMAVDIGAENTNLVVVDGDSVWTRSLPIGGNDFTRAIATKYGLEFEQAETLKRSMDRSKKASEIFEALRPSLRSLLDEIQRSAGYYRSLHKTAKFVKLLGFGGGFKMFGVQRFLEAGLAYPVEVYGKTNNILTDNAVNRQFFKKSAPGFGAALGLAVQGLGYGGINTNLMPPAILNERLLKKKRPMLIAAASMLAGAFVLSAAMAFVQPTKYAIDNDPRIAQLQKDSDKEDQFKKFMNVNKTMGEIQSLMQIKKDRAEVAEAFELLMAGIPKDEEYPVYVMSIAMEVLDGQAILAVIRDPAKEKALMEKDGLVIEPVSGADYIAEAEAERVRKTTTAARNLSMDEREKRIEEREMAAELRRENRMAAGAARRAGATAGANAANTGKRAKAKFQIKGKGYVAQLAIETAHPEGDVRIRQICDEMKKTNGVKWCDYFYSAKETYWENTETHARDSEQPRAQDMEFYNQVEYTSAVLQWVYDPKAAESAAVSGDSDGGESQDAS